MSLQVQEAFWTSMEGILQRIALLAKNYAWQIYGIIIGNHAEQLIWRTNPEMSKSGPCDFCIDLEAGSPYKKGEEPDYPAHPDCCCDLDLVEANEEP